MKTKKPQLIPSIRRLAKQLGRDEKTVRGYLADPRWTFPRKSPWSTSDLPAMRAWLITALEQRDGGDIDADPALDGLTPERRAKLALVVERCAKVKLERELLAGRYLLKEDVLADLVRRAAEAKQTFQLIVNLAPRLVGRDEGDVRRLLAEHVELCCSILAKDHPQ